MKTKPFGSSSPTRHLTCEPNSRCAGRGSTHDLGAEVTVGIPSRKYGFHVEAFRLGATALEIGGPGLRGFFVYHFTFLL